MRGGGGGSGLLIFLFCQVLFQFVGALSCYLDLLPTIPTPSVHEMQCLGQPGGNLLKN